MVVMAWAMDDREREIRNGLASGVRVVNATEIPKEDVVREERRLQAVHDECDANEARKVLPDDPDPCRPGTAIEGFPGWIRCRGEGILFLLRIYFLWEK